MEKAKFSALERQQQVQMADQELHLIADWVAHIRQLNAHMSNATDNQNQVATSVNSSISNISQLV